MTVLLKDNEKAHWRIYFLVVVVFFITQVA